MLDCKRALVKFEEWGEYGPRELAIEFKDSIEINERKQLVVDGVVISVKGQFNELVLDDNEVLSESFNSDFNFVKDYYLNN